jgi:hypothetical protein
VLRVTVDTNVLDDAKVERIGAAIDGLGVEIAPTTVTLRERRPNESEIDVLPVVETGVWNESRSEESVWGPAPPVYETLTIGESRLGMAALGGNESPSRFEAALAIMSNGSFPRPGERDSLTRGQRRQLRDAMIFEAHAREGRDVLVSDDRDFIGAGVREKLEAIGQTRIMSVNEFCEYCARDPSRSAESDS